MIQVSKLCKARCMSNSETIMKNINGTVKEIIIAAHLNLYSKLLKQIHSNGKVKKTKVKGLISNCKIHITSQSLYIFLII